MRVKSVILVVAVLGGAAFLGLGIYRYLTVSPFRAPEVGTVTAPTAPRSGSVIPFSKPAAPKPLPELRFVAGMERELTLDAFRGRMVLLNIWATWCVPCREEMPALDRLQARLGGSDFQVIPLSIDRGGLPAVRAFYRELGLESLEIYVDQTGRAATRLGATGIPTTLLIDRKGREIGRKVGPAEWDSDEVLGILQRYAKPEAAPDRDRDRSGRTE